jgi:hypothetical protein
MESKDQEEGAVEQSHNEMESIGVESVQEPQNESKKLILLLPYFSCKYYHGSCECFNGNANYSDIGETGYFSEAAAFRALIKLGFENAHIELEKCDERLFNPLESRDERRIHFTETMISSLMGWYYEQRPASQSLAEMEQKLREEFCRRDSIKVHYEFELKRIKMDNEEDSGAEQGVILM